MQIRLKYFYIILFVILLLPALVNGFPLYFYNDSWEYLANANANFYSSRSVFYGLLTLPLFQALKVFGLQAWSAPIMNSLIFIAALFFSSHNEIKNHLKIALIILFSLFSFLPIYTSYILPDIYLSCGFLALHTLLAKDVGSRNRFALLAILFISTIVHIANAPLFALTLFLGGLLYKKKWRDLRSLYLTLVLAIMTLLSPNLYFYNRPTLSPISALWPIASLSETHLLEKILNTECRKNLHYSKMCKHLDKRIHFESDMLIWNYQNNIVHASFTDNRFPYPSQGYWDQLGRNVSKEIFFLYKDAFINFPMEFIYKFTGRILKQIVNPERQLAQDNLDKMGLIQGDSKKQLTKLIGERGLNQISNSTEYRTVFIRTKFYNFIHYLSIILAVISLILTVTFKHIFQRKDSVFLISFIFLNYAESGLLACPDDRLFNRAIWILPFFLLINFKKAKKDSYSKS